MTAKLQPGSPEEVGMLPERIAHARDLCRRWVKEGHTPTLGVCVARRGVIVLDEAFGVLGPGPDSPPLDRHAIYAVGSVTKPVTATLVMQLVEDGLLGLNRPAKDYLPDISGDGTDEILVHHLLTHTSGYLWHNDPPMTEHMEKKLAAGFTPPPCPERRDPFLHQMLSFFWDAPRVARAGEVMIYSNHNYELLGEIVRRLSGRALEELARERIFDRLGMEDSYYVVPESESTRVVQRASGLPFAEAQDGLPGIGSRMHQEMASAGGGIFTTPGDMTIFAQTMLNGGRYGDARILSPAAVAAMTRDQIPGIDARFFNKVMSRASWGYGWQIESPTKWPYFHGSLQPLGTFGHPGVGGSNFWIDRKHEIVGAYFEVTTRVTENMDHLWNFDLFQNVITSAVDD
jgi:CubicO group peptidase (beta-lactamase class C family)